MMLLCPVSTRDVIAASGELDISGARPLVEATTGAAGTVQHLTVDLSAVTFMDGAGLAALLDIRNRLHRRGGCLRLRAPHEHVRYLLRLLDMQDAFVIVD